MIGIHAARFEKYLIDRTPVGGKGRVTFPVTLLLVVPQCWASLQRAPVAGVLYLLALNKSSLNVSSVVLGNQRAELPGRCREFRRHHPAHQWWPEWRSGSSGPVCQGAEGVGMSLWRWLGLAALVGCSVFFTWKVGTWRYGKQLADLSASYQADLTTISNAAAAQARQALELQQATQKALAELDAKATTEKAHALAENEKLRADVAAGDRRLRIAGRCSADSSNLSGTTSAARLDDGGTVELAGAAGRTVFDIRAGIIKDRAALKGLQEYVREVCQ